MKTHSLYFRIHLSFQRLYRNVSKNSKYMSICSQYVGNLHQALHILSIDCVIPTCRPLFLREWHEEKGPAPKNSSDTLDQGTFPRNITYQIFLNRITLNYKYIKFFLHDWQFTCCWHQAHCYFIPRLTHTL